MMSKFFKISILFVLFIFSITYITNAETTNLYDEPSNETFLDDSNTTNTNENITNTPFLEDEMDLSDESSNTDSQTSTTSITPSNAKISTLSSIPEANLGLNNILCIILIALGILIVLLAIAILIRLNR